MKKLKNAKVLDSTQQKNINGGRFHKCPFSDDDTTDWCCHLPQGCP